MQLFPSRGGWPFAGPPSCDFVLNTTTPQAQGLVAWWPTLGSCGATAFDRAGAFNGIVSAPSISNTGLLGPVRTYNGTSDDITIADHSALTLQQFTVTQWLRWGGTTGDPYYRCSVSKGAFSGGEFTVLFRVSTSAVEARFYVEGAERSNYTSTLDTAWHLWTWSYDQNTTRIYYDGVQVDSDVIGAVAITNTALNMYIGSNNGTAYFWEGDIGETRFYNRALLPAEVRAMRANPWELYRPMLPGFYGKAAAGTTYYETPAGVLTPAGAVSRFITQSARAGSLTPAGAVAKQTQPAAITGGFTSAGALAHLPQLPQAGAITPAGAISRAMGKPQAGAITPAGAVTKHTVGATLTGALTFVGAVIRAGRKTLAGILTPAGAVIKRTAKVFAGAITPAGAESRLKIVLRSLAGAMSFVGAVDWLPKKVLTGALTPAGTIIRKITKTFAGAFTPGGALAAAKVAISVIAFTVASRVTSFVVAARGRVMTVASRVLGFTVEDR